MAAADMDPVLMAKELRRRERRRRRRRMLDSDKDDSDQDEDEPSDFPAWKTMVVIAIIIGCFAILYPKMFHPMLMLALGMNSREQEVQPSSPHPPHRGAPPPSNDPHLHAGPPHPAMRMAGGGVGAGRTPDAGGAGAGGPRGKGMWHWLLPFYTVGVIVFLLYTLSKIMWKSKKKSKGRRYASRFGASSGSDSDSSSDEEEKGVAGRGLSTKELKGLHKRLNQTESAMQKILGQLETLSANTDPATAAQVKEMTMETLNNLAKVEATATSLEDAEKKTSRKRGKKRESKPKETRYLADLERALSEFKKFTEDYVQEHAEAAIKRELDHMTEEKAARKASETLESSTLEQNDESEDEDSEHGEEKAKAVPFSKDEEDGESSEAEVRSEVDRLSHAKRGKEIEAAEEDEDKEEAENGEVGDEATPSEEEEEEEEEEDEEEEEEDDEEEESKDEVGAGASEGAGNVKQKAKEESPIDGEEEEPERGFDVMEADQNGLVEVGEAVGEILDLSEEANDAHRNVRRRPRPT